MWYTLSTKNLKHWSHTVLPIQVINLILTNSPHLAKLFLWSPFGQMSSGIIEINKMLYTLIMFVSLILKKLCFCSIDKTQFKLED